MYLGGGKATYWRRHPRLKLAFAFVWAFALATVVAWICAVGSFHIGRGRDAAIISQADSPFTFWFVIAAFVGLLIAVPAVALREYLVQHRNERDKGDE